MNPPQADRKRSESSGCSWEPDKAAHCSSLLNPPEHSSTFNICIIMEQKKRRTLTQENTSTVTTRTPCPNKTSEMANQTTNYIMRAVMRALTEEKAVIRAAGLRAKHFLLSYLHDDMLGMTETNFSCRGNGRGEQSSGSNRHEHTKKVSQPSFFS